MWMGDSISVLWKCSECLTTEPTPALDFFIVGGGDLVCNIVGFSFVFCFSPQNYS